MNNPGMEIPKTMRASVLMGKGVIEMQERAVPSPDADEVLVKVACVSVCGSDVHYYKEGRIGDFVVESPMVLGHEVSGKIVAVGRDVPPGRIGERVAIEPQRPCRTCSQCMAGRYNLCPEMKFYATPPVDGAFQEYVTIQSIFAHKIPDSLSDESAALLEPLSVGIWACQKARIGPGSRVFIAGAGPIGTITAQAARGYGASEVIVSDLMEDRRKRVMEFGATRTIDPAKESVRDLGVDAFIDCSGATPAIQSGITAVRNAGHVVLVGMGADEVPLPLPIIQVRELTVTGTFRYTGTWPVAAAMASQGKLNLDALITSKYDLEHVREALEASLDPSSLKPFVYP